MMSINNIRRSTAAAVTESIPISIMTDSNHSDGRKHVNNHHDRDVSGYRDGNDGYHSNYNNRDDDDDSIVIFGSSHIHRVNTYSKSSSSSSSHTMNKNGAIHKNNTLIRPRKTDPLLSRLVSSKDIDKNKKTSNFTIALNSIINKEIKDNGVYDSDIDDNHDSDNDDDDES